MLVLFDLDDTLLDHTSAMRTAATALWRSFSNHLPLDGFLTNWASSHERNYPRYLSGALTYQGQRRARIRETIDPSLDNAAADRTFEVYFESYRDAWSLFPDAADCLQRLAGHRLGVISNGQSKEQRMKLARTGIDRLFNYVLISEECTAAKPTAEIFLHACNEARESPQNTVDVSDRYDLDAEGARLAGLRGIWLDRRRKRTPNHHSPIIESLDELPPLIDSLAETVIP